MQSVNMSDAALVTLLADEERAAALGRIHHEHLGNGRVRVSKVYTGTHDRDIHDAMDRDLAVLQAHGADNVRRTRIGRNSPCHCGSGRKFKKCCITAAERVGRR